MEMRCRRKCKLWEDCILETGLSNEESQKTLHYPLCFEAPESIGHLFFLRLFCFLILSMVIKCSWGVISIPSSLTRGL
ncbi:hypothetical protein H5410_037996, partial [Solanum commersonii]